MNLLIAARRSPITDNTRMLKMAFINILNNTINYAVSAPPSVEINTINNNVHIKIYNDGEIIPEDDRKKLFTHFFRARTAPAKKGLALGWYWFIEL